MITKCLRKNGIKIKNHFIKALVAASFLLFLIAMCHYSIYVEAFTVENRESNATGNTVQKLHSIEPEGTEKTEGTEATEATDTVITQTAENNTQITDLTQAFEVILQGATKEFIAGYAVDESFLMWVDAQYGDESIIELAYCVLDQNLDVNRWYEITGNSIYVLWLSYCRDTGFQTYQLGNVYWMNCQSSAETVISFAGDFNFAEDWCTTEYMETQPNGVYDCFSEELLQMMKNSDLMVMNNEFVYSDRGVPLTGKDYTFRASTEKAGLLTAFGTDLVNLANNHVYDYGQIGLMDTMSQLNTQNIAYVGAGKNLEEASKILYYVANGKKIAIVSASEIERSIQYTKEATEDSCGVLKTLNPAKFIQVIQEANANSDYVIAITHWGTEGTLHADKSQQRLAKLFVEAGADVIIGGHPHRLQGAAFIENVPVAYSLGNFWFSTGTLYTTLAQVVIHEDGSLQLKYQPCIQKDLTTSLITDTNEKDDFYHYLTAISQGVGIDADGNVYNIDAPGEVERGIVYDSKTSETAIIGLTDNDGNVIDIVGNLK